MSTLNVDTLSIPEAYTQPHAADGQEDVSSVKNAVERVSQKIAPVWPLKDYVAVNPYAGFVDQEFLSARHSLRSVSVLETLMPVDYYREQFVAGKLVREDIVAAVDEMVADGVAGAERVDVNQIVALLRLPGSGSPTADAQFSASDDPDRALRTFTEILDRETGSHWSRLVLEEISKHCADHYDDGQAAWSNPWRELPLYDAWRLTVRHDRSFEVLGVAGLRDIVEDLPDHPQAALGVLLRRLQVPGVLWEDFLLCLALAMPGWSAWTKYQCEQAQRRGEDKSDFAGLLAMRLAYELALSQQFEYEVDWAWVAKYHRAPSEQAENANDESLLRYALLKASEIAFRKELLAKLTPGTKNSFRRQSVDRRLAQMVFCIDVRSERIRRHLEATSRTVETFGFAGFFGLPIEFVRLGETSGSSQVPALISPVFKVYEKVDAGDAVEMQAVSDLRSQFRFLRKAWREFQASATSCFAFVETTGLFYGCKLLARTLGKTPVSASRFDGIARGERERLGPTMDGLLEQGVDLTRQTEMAEAVLRGIGIISDFGRLVVFCGHGSETENNPLQAGLDCGACCGHSGEPNARFAARLLNRPVIREGLAARGIVIPEETHFVAALHNTTTDEIQFLDAHLVPASHEADLQQLRSLAEAASVATRRERLPLLPGHTTDDLIRRSRDWSEVRPEWGLAGNAAFIAAPRELTENSSLQGRSFLHSYDYRSDQGFAFLEQIMTAPMIVANWINMQYFASTVDPAHFGSGNKTLHNVVGRFGIFSGNGGDLMTGLPWQSVHDGQRYQHHPLRLLAVIAAPRHAIEAIIDKHEIVANLLANGWVHLVAVEDGEFFRFTERRSWEALRTHAPQLDTTAALCH